MVETQVALYVLRAVEKRATHLVVAPMFPRAALSRM